MLFNSFEFIWFFLIVYAAYTVLQHRAQNVLLLVASYVFYGFWDPRFLILIVISTLLDYSVGRILGSSTNERTRRLAVTASLAGNLGILGFFKYFNFFVASMNDLVASFGFDPAGLHLEIVLPVGISFYTFQTLSYTIDIYRGKLKPTHDLLDMAVYVAFFPQLVAGPIERATRFLPQVQKARRVTYTHIREGAWLILLGYFKKVVIADNLAPYVNQVFSDPGAASGAELLLGAYAFAFQIYGDFSGYSDIARGVAKLMGFDLMVNFRMPYFAVNPSDFWRRWHISLSTWLRDYLYISLGGNRRGALLTYRNLLLTMLLGGLWHGAAWHFVIWGLYHGLLLIGHRLLTLAAGEANAANRLWHWCKVLLFFQLTCIGWIIFRVDTAADIPVILERIALWAPGGVATTDVWVQAGWLLFLILPLMVLQVFKERSDDLLVVKRWSPAARVAMYAVLFAYISLCGVTEGEEFIYFQF